MSPSTGPVTANGGGAEVSTTETAFGGREGVRRSLHADATSAAIARDAAVALRRVAAGRDSCIVLAGGKRPRAPGARRESRVSNAGDQSGLVTRCGGSLAGPACAPIVASQM